MNLRCQPSKVPGVAGKISRQREPVSACAGQRSRNGLPSHSGPGRPVADEHDVLVPPHEKLRVPRGLTAEQHRGGGQELPTLRAAHDGTRSSQRSDEYRVRAPTASTGRTSSYSPCTTKMPSIAARGTHIQPAKASTAQLEATDDECGPLRRGLSNRMAKMFDTYILLHYSAINRSLIRPFCAAKATSRNPLRCELHSSGVTSSETAPITPGQDRSARALRSNCRR